MLYGYKHLYTKHVDRIPQEQLLAKHDAAAVEYNTNKWVLDLL